VACPNYRLAPGASLDEIVTDCRRAIGFLALNPNVTGMPVGEISVIGHSASGQLAAVMASTDWPAFDARLSADLLHGWIGVSGFYDIEPFRLTGFQANTRFTDEAYRRWSPVNLVRAGLPPGLLITGGQESGLLHEMMDGYAGLLREKGVATRTIDAAGEDHFSVLARVGDRDSEVHRLALAMVR
jgi:arylformamidase